MASIQLSEALKQEYNRLFNSCIIDQSKEQSVEKIVTKILNNKPRYKAAGDPLNIPWFFIAVIHNMEASLNFKLHFHNGDPLTARTINVPAGRPKSGNPPFTWEESAADALVFERLHLWGDWSAAGLLYKLEAYNGWGYRKKHPHVLSPYLWSYSNHYSSGKFVADGRWSENAISQQCGGAVLLRRLVEKNEIKFEDARPATEPFLYFSNKKTTYGESLQKFLNQLPEIYLREDGKPGEKTSDAFKKATGYFLNGDPRY